MGCAPAQGVAAAAPAFVPTDISGLALWLDASDETTLFQGAGVSPVTADGQLVRQWNDKSGNARHVSQATAGNRPLYKTGVQNSKSAALFDGTDDYIFNNSVGPFSQPNTMFFVYKFVATGAGAKNVFSSKTTSETQFYKKGTGEWSVYCGTAEATFNTADTSVHYATLVLNGASSSARLNGSAQTLSANPGTQGINAYYLACYENASFPVTLFANVYIMEVLHYSGALSAGDITSVESYLAAKWGI